MTEYVYALWDGLNAEAFYVGMTSQPRSRLQSHCYGGRGQNEDKDAWIQSLREADCPVEMLLLMDGRTRSIAETLERLWMSYFIWRGAPVTNQDITLVPKPAVPWGTFHQAFDAALKIRLSDGQDLTLEKVRAWRETERLPEVTSEDMYGVDLP